MFTCALGVFFDRWPTYQHKVINTDDLMMQAAYKERIFLLPCVKIHTFSNWETRRVLRLLLLSLLSWSTVCWIALAVSGLLDAESWCQFSQLLNSLGHFLVVFFQIDQGKLHERLSPADLEILIMNFPERSLQRLFISRPTYNPFINLAVW